MSKAFWSGFWEGVALIPVWRTICGLWNAPGCSCNSNQGRKPCVCNITNGGSENGK